MRAGLGMRVGASAVGLSIGLAIAASPAAAEGELGLSPDGTTWRSELTTPLFDPAIRWVPGDERTSAFFVRNQAADAADLAIAVATRDQDRLMAGDDIAVSARVGSAGWTPLDQVGSVYPLSTGTVAPGETERVQVRAAFDAASTNQSQTKELHLEFRVVLSDARGGPGAGTGDGGANGDSGSSGVLPDTGAPRMGWMLLASAAMMGVGVALVRRSREEEADV